MITQLCINGLAAGSLVALLAAGFTIFLGGSRFFAFTYGASYTWAAYSLLVLSRNLHFPLPVAVVLSILAASILGMALEKLIFAPLRKTGNSALPIMLSSIGAYIIFQNIVSMVFGDVTLSVRDWPTMPGHIFLGARISRLQGLDIIIPWTCLGFVWILLRLTPLGRQLRAVSEDPELAQIFGIDTKTTILWSTALGSGLAGLAGALASIDTDMVPTIGFYAFLLGVVASILGGRDSIIGAVLSGLLLGLIPQLGAWGIDTQWQDTIIFGVLVIFLALQPGAPMRAAISGLKASP